MKIKAQNNHPSLIKKEFIRVYTLDTGEKFLGVEVNELMLSDYIDVLRNYIGAKDAIEYCTNQRRDYMDKFILVVASPQELEDAGVNVDNLSDVWHNKESHGLYHTNIELLGLCEVELEDMKEWYIAVQSYGLYKYREKLGIAPKMDYHLSVAYTHRELEEMPHTLSFLVEEREKELMDTGAATVLSKL